MHLLHVPTTEYMSLLSLHKTIKVTDFVELFTSIISWGEEVSTAVSRGGEEGCGKEDQSTKLVDKLLSGDLLQSHCCVKGCEEHCG